MRLFPAQAILACSLATAMALFPPPVHSAGARPGDAQRDAQRDATSPDGTPLRLVLALDGIPFDVFADLQQQGRFPGFHPATRMVSTFPSLSDVAFAAIDGNAPPDGYQTTHFDPASNRLVGNTISSLSERSHPKILADSRQHTTIHRVMGYVSANRVAARELWQISDDLMRSRKETFVAYVGTSDAVLHLAGRAGADRFLDELDRFLADLQVRVRERTGRPLRIDIVSDHGSTLVQGKAVEVDAVLEGCGFRRRSRMSEPNDAAYSLPGIVGSVAITVAPARIEDAARCLAGAEGVDLVAVNRGEAVGVLTADGEAEVRAAPGAGEAWLYRNLRGDPLGLLAGGSVPGEHAFEQAATFAHTVDAHRPDPLRRLWRAFHGEVNRPSSLLLSLADGYEVGNPALLALTRLRGGHWGTHGSMTRLASLGVLASNWRATPDVNASGANEVLFGAGTLAALRQSAAPPEQKQARQ